MTTLDGGSSSSRPGARAGEPARVDVTGAVIAGGESRRMGIDKRSMLVEGVPLLRRVVESVAAVADEVVVACRRGSPPDPALFGPHDVRIAYDRLEDGGPAAGLEAALEAARGELVVIAACDMPWIAPALLQLLLDRARAHPEARVVALRTHRGPEPLLAVYRRQSLPDVTALLDAGTRRMHEVLAALAPLEVGPATWRRSDPSGHSPVNLNAPEDLAADVAGSRPQPTATVAGPRLERPAAVARQDRPAGRSSSRGGARGG
jgi:molybdopterin-guanine dinucleotide biosynthesis protein A